jgi:hypothetical protein
MLFVRTNKGNRSRIQAIFLVIDGRLDPTPANEPHFGVGMMIRVYKRKLRTMLSQNLPDDGWSSNSRLV